MRRILETERFMLLPATRDDLPAMLRIYGDDETMRFVPLFPPKDLIGMERVYEESWTERDDRRDYLIREKDTGEVIGYVKLELCGARDLGYGVRRDRWHTGVASEAAAAVLQEARAAGVDFVTATHDRENPHSGGVMRKIGMTYRYSYREQWMPKDISVVFRMYQIELNGDNIPTYDRYREIYNENFVEEIR